jgi:hypothetical protein
MDFGAAILVIVLVVLPIAAVLFVGAFGMLEELGQGQLAINERPTTPAPPPGSTAARVEREQEIRQLVQARHDRGVARGEEGVDVESEVRRLLAADADSAPEKERQEAALRDEIRQLVIARNSRRAGRGEPPLDVETEVERQLRSLGG